MNNRQQNDKSVPLVIVAADLLSLVALAEQYANKQKAKRSAPRSKPAI